MTSIDFAKEVRDVVDFLEKHECVFEEAARFCLNFYAKLPDALVLDSLTMALIRLSMEVKVSGWDYTKALGCEFYTYLGETDYCWLEEKAPLPHRALMAAIDAAVDISKRKLEDTQKPGDMY